MTEHKNDGDIPHIIEINENDPAMSQAFETARSTFRFFWREIVRDRSRILPLNEAELIKAPFCEVKRQDGRADKSRTEQMWISKIDFDGRHISGVLMNSPRWITSVKEGDDVTIELHDISDWVCVKSHSEVFGAYTVNVLRSRMSPQERKFHDRNWNLEFGDPLITKNFEEFDSPTLTRNLLISLKESLEANISHLSHQDHKGWTVLHREASVGNPKIVRCLLDLGANRDAFTNNGLTPLDLANVLGWSEVAKLLTVQ